MAGYTLRQLTAVLAYCKDHPDTALPAVRNHPWPDGMTTEAWRR